MQKMTTVGAKITDPKIAQSAATSPFLRRVRSKDGTAIAFDRLGHGIACDSRRRRTLLSRRGSNQAAG
jgi:hypothetical protein